MHVLGLDVGTQSAKAVICNESGDIIAEASKPFDAEPILRPPGWAEQHPHDWWEAACVCLRSVIDQIRWKGIPAEAIKAVAVDSTSGTIIPLDKTGIALRPAIMYNDTRAVEEAEECNSAGRELTDKLGYKFSSAFSLPKALWIKKHEPEVFEQTSCFAHAADYIVSRLTGNFRLSDTSNALKTGYDLISRRWPSFIAVELGIPLDRFPQIATPGLTIGVVSAAGARDTELKPGTPVVAGVTDGTAGFLASGAVRVGDWNSTIGTTLVIRGVSTEVIKDPQGRIYCHSHPQGYWLPGGASNVGAECLSKLFHDQNLEELSAYVSQYTPTSLIVYPLVRTGERLPFVNPKAEGFVIGEPRHEYDLYAGYLEGVGYVERWCLELMEELGAEVGDTIYTTGGGAKSEEWMQVRADILNRRVTRPASAECAMGTAAVAASNTLFAPLSPSNGPDLSSAVKSMIKPGPSVDPDPALVPIYEERYQAFRSACADRGYQ
jgi:sugar (pentulose or hexulose) kinase